MDVKNIITGKRRLKSPKRYSPVIENRKRKRDEFNKDNKKNSKFVPNNKATLIKMTKEETKEFKAKRKVNNHVREMADILALSISKLSENISVDADPRRVSSVRKMIMNGIKAINENRVNQLKIGEYLVTSSDNKKTYIIREAQISSEFYYVCNCGVEYGKNEKLYCCHIYAVVYYKTNQVTKFAFQKTSDTKIFEDVCEMDYLVNHMCFK